ncbi:iron permease FTR1 [Cystobasidium minutum MCA 4210]|uniref:iron permease FTR1 n=1 Tax=Cystobasidium minutum MCA 4210 TaxID=1397322 RepID=UPI0034CF6DCA|eukprot:jgi/Rhomi1/153240/estExt_Genewise1.C_4_t30293
MAKDLFSVPIFFILFRETLEAAIIVSVLLALVEQLVSGTNPSHPGYKGVTTHTLGRGEGTSNDNTDRVSTTLGDDSDLDKHGRTLTERRLLRKLRIQIFAGAGIGLLIALAVGAAFIAVFYTQVRDLYGASEDIWEGVFALIASIMIWVMALGFLRMDRAKLKWKIKLEKAFAKQQDKLQTAVDGEDVKVKRSLGTKYALLILPAITVAREGLEAVVFLGGVSLGEPGSSIPLAAICGLAAGLAVGYLLYKSSSRLNLSIFLVASTCFLLLIGAGLLSKSVGYFETYKYAQLVGGDVAETGTGPGSYSVHGNVWHLNCCSPEATTSGYGWSIFNAILGWNNNASIGTILSYVFYWLSVIAALIYMRWSEGRVAVLGKHSKVGKERLERQQVRSTTVRDSNTTAVEEDIPKGSPGLDADKRISPSNSDDLHVTSREIVPERR